MLGIDNGVHGFGPSGCQIGTGLQFPEGLNSLRRENSLIKDHSL